MGTRLKFDRVQFFVTQKNGLEICYIGVFLTSWFVFVPTFNTKVMEYLCLGWVFFSSDKFRLFN